MRDYLRGNPKPTWQVIAARPRERHREGMSNTPSLIDSIVARYLATWNEPDAARRAALVAETFTPAARYVDPLARAEGSAQLAGLIGAVQARFPGLVFTRCGVAELHDTFARFSWSLGPVGGQPIAGGTDFAVLEGERIASVTGFLDAVPASAVAG
jgi:hypothetical protein